MSIITIERASIDDADRLTALKKVTFDKEVKKWLSTQDDVIDFNIQPPGYSSIEMTNYMIKKLNYFKVVYDEVIVGGVIVTVSGKSYGRIDRIFIAPDYQGKGIGSKVIDLIEKEFPTVRTWDLETSSRQINNHRFYEKMGYRTTFETDDEFCYIKKLGTPKENEHVIEDKELTSIQYENCNMAKTECYQVNMEESSFSNSNLMHTHVSNCNLSHSKFQNINFRNTLFADLNLSKSELVQVTLSGVHFIDTNQGNEKNLMSFERCDLEGGKLTNCNLRNVEIDTCEMEGMKINNIPVEELLEAYAHVNKKTLSTKI